MNFKNICFTSLLTLGIIASTSTLHAASEPFEIEGKIARTTIGGVETPRAQAFLVAGQTFVAEGPMAGAVEASVGQHLAIRGMLIRRMAVGGEGVPSFCVGELSLTKVEGTEGLVTLLGRVQPGKEKTTVGGRTFIPAGPLAPALAALKDCEVAITGIANPPAGLTATESLFIASIGRRDLTKRNNPTNEVLLEKLSQDAVGRYSLVHPGTPEGCADGSGPRLKSARFVAGSNRFEIVVETFGGIIGGPMGNEMLYVYDVQGKLLTTATL